MAEKMVGVKMTKDAHETLQKVAAEKGWASRAEVLRKWGLEKAIAWYAKLKAKQSR